MNEVIEFLELKARSLQHCLDDKNWASSKSDYHKKVRIEYKKRLYEFKKAIEILTTAHSRA